MTKYFYHSSSFIIVVVQAQWRFYLHIQRLSAHNKLDRKQNFKILSVSEMELCHCCCSLDTYKFTKIDCACLSYKGGRQAGSATRQLFTVCTVSSNVQMHWW